MLFMGNQCSVNHQFLSWKHSYKTLAIKRASLHSRQVHKEPPITNHANEESLLNCAIKATYHRQAPAKLTEDLACP